VSTTHPPAGQPQCIQPQPGDLTPSPSSCEGRLLHSCFDLSVPGAHTAPGALELPTLFPNSSGCWQGFPWIPEFLSLPQEAGSGKGRLQALHLLTGTTLTLTASPSHCFKGQNPLHCECTECDPGTPASSASLQDSDGQQPHSTRTFSESPMSMLLLTLSLPLFHLPAANAGGLWAGPHPTRVPHVTCLHGRSCARSTGSSSLGSMGNM
jgi:hypothetical protein